jgi:hypothetical protein
MEEEAEEKGTRPETKAERIKRLFGVQPAASASRGNGQRTDPAAYRGSDAVGSRTPKPTSDWSSGQGESRKEEGMRRLLAAGTGGDTERRVPPAQDAGRKVAASARQGSYPSEASGFVTPMNLSFAKATPPASTTMSAPLPPGDAVRTKITSGLHDAWHKSIVHVWRLCEAWHATLSGAKDGVDLSIDLVHWRDSFHVACRTSVGLWHMNEAFKFNSLASVKAAYTRSTAVDASTDRFECAFFGAHLPCALGVHKNDADAAIEHATTARTVWWTTVAVDIDEPNAANSSTATVASLLVSGASASATGPPDAKAAEAAEAAKVAQAQAAEAAMVVQAAKEEATKAQASAAEAHAKAVGARTKATDATKVVQAANEKAAREKAEAAREKAEAEAKAAEAEAKAAAAKAAEAQAKVAKAARVAEAKAADAKAAEAKAAEAQAKAAEAKANSAAIAAAINEDANTQGE